MLVVTLISMFKVPSSHVHVSDWQKHKDTIISSLENNLEFTKPNSVPYTTSYYTDKNLSKFQDFFNLIQNYVGGKRIVECWYQTYRKGEHHSLHNHGPLGFSAVFYAKLGKGHKGTTFYSPFPDTNGNLIEYTPRVIEGDLIIFPAYLSHCFQPSDMDEERAVIAFNMR